MKLSIVTINLNNAIGLEKTLTNLFNQPISRDKIQSIVIDGGSTDGSLDIIKSFQDKIDYWISEKDNGIYNAMNKGIAIADGDYINFMNSGDYFAQGVLTDEFLYKLDSDIIYGDCLTTRDYLHFELSKQPESLSLYNFYFGCICHQATFIKTEVQKKYLFDESMRYASCRKFFIESIILNNIKSQYIDIPVAVYDLNGVSATQKEKLVQEIEQYLTALLPENIIKDYKHLNQQTKVINNSKIYPWIERLHPYRGKKIAIEKMINFIFKILFRFEKR